MKILFKLALLSILIYLTADIAIRNDEGGSRPIVQAIGGISLILVSWYNLRNLSIYSKLSSRLTFFKFWRLFIGLMIIYYCIGFNSIPSYHVTNSPRDLVIAIYIFAVALFFFYGTIRQHLSVGLLNTLIIVVLFNGLFEIFYAFITARNIDGVDVINTSAGYIFVMILPLLLFKFQKYNIWIFIIALILTMLTGKRGALVIFIFLFLYGLYNFRWIKKTFKLNWKILFFLVLIVFGYLFFIDSAFESLEYRLLTIQDEKRNMIASGRDVIWQTLLTKWLDSDFIGIIFGYGFFATISLGGNFAHNDFIEFLVDFGVIGLIVYSLVLIFYLRNIGWIKKMNRYLKVLLLFCFLIWLGRAIIAGTIRTDQIILSMSIGYLFGIAIKQKFLYE
ncbi:O-antigen ligase family protein [Winogradskyella poriferorum]|uniref:O-antigen ligase family protein n=1 Tax=Winogradskyella poriferorum TaxID=307627 RepID=UPI003D64FC77